MIKQGLINSKLKQTAVTAFSCQESIIYYILPNLNPVTKKNFTCILCTLDAKTITKQREMWNFFWQLGLNLRTALYFSKDQFMELWLWYHKFELFKSSSWVNKNSTKLLNKSLFGTFFLITTVQRPKLDPYLECGQQDYHKFKLLNLWQQLFQYNPRRYHNWSQRSSLCL